MSLRNEHREGYKKTRVGWIPEQWEVVKGKEFCTLKAGGTPSTRHPEYWGGDIPWMKSGDLNLKKIRSVDGRITKLGLKNSSSIMIPTHSVLIGLAGQGKTRGTVAINEIELCTNQSVAAYIPNEKDADFHYLFYTLERRYQELRRLSTGDGGRGGLNLKILGNIKFPLPPLPEQQKIAAILSTWDRAIEQVEALIAAKQHLKKGLMQQLLTGKLRFPGFGAKAKNGELPEGWHEVRLGEHFKLIKRKNKENNTLVLTISGRYGLINQRDFFNKSVAGKDLSGYYLLEKGEFAYNRSFMKGYPFGAIKRLDDYDKGTLSTLYICFALDSTEVNSGFYKHYFEAGMLNHELYKVVQMGARAHGLLNINLADFLNTKILVPSLVEQQEIALVISNTETELNMNKQHLDCIKKQKQGLMQKLLTGEVRVKV